MKKREKPYVGQLVYWRESISDDPQAAIVTHVSGPLMVSVAVFTPQGYVEPRNYVNYWDGKGGMPTSRIVSEE